MGLSSEEAVLAIGNRYEMVLIASIRARELKRGNKSKLPTKSKNNAIVTALNEIEAGYIGRDYLNKVGRDTMRR